MKANSIQGRNSVRGEGRRAFSAGVPLCDCPEKHPVLKASWKEGWFAAQHKRYGFNREYTLPNRELWIIRAMRRGAIVHRVRVRERRAGIPVALDRHIAQCDLKGMTCSIYLTKTIHRLNKFRLVRQSDDGKTWELTEEGKGKC